jgi:hypothetical protein
MSYKIEVQTDDSGKWYGNALRFAYQEEAAENARDLMGRWFAVRAWRVVDCDDPVNYRFITGRLVSHETAGA